MNFQFRKFYDVATTENNGGGAAETIEQTDTLIAPNTPPADEKLETPAAAIANNPVFTDEDVKGFGFDSKDEFKKFVAEKLQQQKESSITDEDRKAQADIEKADFLSFSAKNKLLNVDDYSAYENLKGVPDADLVYKNYKEDYKAEHPEITDDTELEEAAREDFNFEYKINSESDKVKEKYAAKLAKEAKEIRSPYESKVTTAQEQFKTQQKVREEYPKFEKFVTDLISKNTPDKTVLFKAKDGETEIPIEIELTAKDREAMAKDFKTPKSFSQYVDGKPEDVESALSKKMQNWIKLNKSDEIAEKSFEAGKGLGVKKGSNVGAENPYALKKGSEVQNFSDETLEQSNARIAKLRQQNKY